MRLGYVVPFLFVLTVVVFFHELGHFLVARWCGVKVEFSIGFGPEIVGVKIVRNALEAVRNSARRLCEVPGDDNAASVPDNEAPAAMSENEKAYISSSSRSVRAPPLWPPARSRTSFWRS